MASHMIQSRLKGGLCNQAFQVAAGYAKSLELNCKFGINYKIAHYGQQGKPHYHYRETFYKNIINTEHMPKTKYDEPHFHYAPLPDDTDMLLDGYFQTEKYFPKIKAELDNLFFFPDEIKLKIDKAFARIDKPILGIHVRLGDYLGASCKSAHFICTKEYYTKALEHFNLKEYTVIVCTDDPANLFDFFPYKDVIFSNSKTDLEDLYLLSQCDSHILTNSSFSWWGNYLGKTKQKTVVPSRWFAKDGPQDYQDIYRDRWIKADV